MSRLFDICLKVPTTDSKVLFETGFSEKGAHEPNATFPNFINNNFKVIYLQYILDIVPNRMIKPRSSVLTICCI